MVAVWAVERERERVDVALVFVRSKPRSGSAPKRVLSRRVGIKFESRRAAAPDLLRLTWRSVVMRVVWRTRREGRSVKRLVSRMNERVGREMNTYFLGRPW